MGGVVRSRSLPELVGCDSGLGGSLGAGVGGVRAAAPPPTELRQLITLKQHYYPEGGWGWVVLASSVFVQILAHGLHTGSGVLPQPVIAKFRPHDNVQSG